MSTPNAYPPHSPLPASAPQTPGASSPDSSSESDADPLPFPYTPGPFSPNTNTSNTSNTSTTRFLGLKGSDRRRPEGTLGRVELLLEGLAEELNTLQTRAEAVYAPRREEDGPLIHATVREVVDSLAQLDELGPLLEEWVPVQVLEYLDEGRNPDDYTRTMLELTAAENQFTNGKVHAVHSYLQTLSAGLADAFPSIAPLVPPPSIPLADGSGSPPLKEQPLADAPAPVPDGSGEKDKGEPTAGAGAAVQSGLGPERQQGEEVDVVMEVDAPNLPGVQEA
ncbi:hypothetical protein CALVIDRAFT_600496 [Calocera viscosa TUFC12733]|uniref:Mediator of RNA polymerase II transcription subunit 10 n=1 Tax=Calocera viscosa (strain TUFC12733) TaxID=1330018 RepID=A0A167JPG1_CALVF|nr:hypothetical protein CALVIDRAFT_600496 [Calocera viscosa TUFC12733]